MPGASFLDTNILVYFSIQASTRSGRAAEIVEAGGNISVQVLNEFANVARSKMRMDWDEISEAVDFISSLIQDHPLNVDTQPRALAMSERNILHIYDATIVAEALEAGCNTL
jgi:predicted nucleic acid-binding protein